MTSGFNGRGDGWIQLGTMALVVLSGGGNWLTTTQTSEVSIAEIHRATQEVHTLYAQLSEMVERQKRLEALLQDINKKVPEHQ